MAESNEPDKVWDEYDLERFLQQQDRKTEKYMELLERFIAEPNRDQIIAREMGWYHLLDKDGEKWVENADSLFDEEFEEDMEDDEATAENGDEDGYEVHPLYQASFALTIWIDQPFALVPKVSEALWERTPAHAIPLRRAGGYAGALPRAAALPRWHAMVKRSFMRQFGVPKALR